MSTVPLQITIRKPHTFKRHFEFYIQDEQVATLIFEKGFGKRATGSFKEWQWQFKKGGFWKQFIDISAQQSPYTKTRVACRWNGRLSFSTDNRDTWLLKPVGFWQRTWGWFNDRDELIIEMKSNQISKQRRGQITVHQPINETLFLLIFIGWIQLLSSEDHAVAAAAS